MINILFEFFKGLGFVSYSTVLDDPNVNGKVLSISGIGDRAYVKIGYVKSFSLNH